MPLKKKGGAGKGKTKKKGVKAAKAAAEKEQMVRTCRNFLKVYQQRCTASGSTASPSICKECRECIESEKPLVKVAVQCWVSSERILPSMCVCALRLREYYVRL